VYETNGKGVLAIPICKDLEVLPNLCAVVLQVFLLILYKRTMRDHNDSSNNMSALLNKLRRSVPNLSVHWAILEETQAQDQDSSKLSP
jgi:hypothetical protein